MSYAVSAAPAEVQPDQRSLQDVTPVNIREYKACGVISLFVACHLQGRETDLSSIARVADPDGDDVTSLKDLSAAARKEGFYPLAVSLSYDELELLPAPAIMHTTNSDSSEHDHFCVYLGLLPEGRVKILDPPVPPYDIDRSVFEENWTGKSLLLFGTREESEAFQKTIEDSRQNRLFSIHLLLSFLLLSACFYQVRLFFKERRHRSTES